MQTLPRFLLPRLSWTAPTAALGSSSSPSSCSPLRATTAISQSWNKPPSQQTARFHATSAVAVGPRRPSAYQAKTKPKSSLLQQHQPALARAFHATTPRARDHHFDTLKFVQRLRDEGFTEEQSVAMMKVLNDVIEER